jgi:tetratricopeptide (TPR) repeat protein
MVSALDAEVARLRRQVSPKRFEIRLPDGADRETQVQAFATEGIAARQMGRRSREALENLRAAKDRLVLGSAQHDAALAILRYAAETEAAVGNYDRAIADDQRTIAQANTPAQRGWLFQLHASLSDIHLTTGDLRGAERSLTELKSVYSESKRWQGLWPTWVADYEASVARVQAVVLDLRGRPAQAERYWREAINRLSVSQCQPKIDRPGGLYTGSRLGTVFLDRCDL